ncbi:hypothetical protein [Streptomyces sp. NBC_01006]|uniref:hypothetical protein n=1 Tax=Streptomyces sp. NBC_01006 TaxID=2903716 RepID=UPI003866A3D2|nr:hypothetical protein OG509_32075 [Streptomyces sp. NBC_01006]
MPEPPSPPARPQLQDQPEYAPWGDAFGSPTPARPPESAPSAAWRDACAVLAATTGATR